MLIYKIDDGETFEGTVEHFQDCFFSNADHDNIIDWAKECNMKVSWEWRTIQIIVYMGR